MKKLLIFLALLMFGQSAHAGPWTVGPQTITYTDAHPRGSINTAPAYGYEAPDVASNFTSATWIHTGSPPSTAGQYDAPGVGAEAKARFDCNVAGFNHDDPIIAPGVPNGASHDHTIFGNLAFANSMYNATYASLRATGNSTCYGGPLNRSLYWEPSMKVQLPTGYIATIKPKNIVTYYEDGALADIGTGKITDPLTVTRWPRGINFIEGFNMATQTRVSDIVAALNAAAGWGHYSTVAAGTGGGFVGWNCLSVISGPTNAASLADISGNATLNCTPGTDLYAELLSDPCWDGKNLTSPDGRGHMMPYIRDNNTGNLVCPDNWYRVMQFRAKVTFNQSGAADYKRWFASSDRMPGMTQWLNGQSMHFDLIPAWEYGTAAAPGVFIKFSVNCDGQTIVMSGTTLTGNGHECGYGRISLTENLWVNEASPDGSQPNPLVVLSPDQTGTNRYFPIVPGATGNGHLHHGKPCTQASPCQSMNDNMAPAANDNPIVLAGAAPISFDLRSKGR